MTSTSPITAAATAAMAGNAMALNPPAAVTAPDIALPRPPTADTTAGLVICEMILANVLNCLIREPMLLIFTS